jgi:hypothetical protein
VRDAHDDDVCCGEVVMERLDLVEQKGQGQTVVLREVLNLDGLPCCLLDRLA